MKKYKTQIIILSIISVAGLGYFLYSKIKIYNLNRKVTSLDEMNIQLENLPVDDSPIEDTPVDPDILPADDFGGGDNVDTTGGISIPSNSLSSSSASPYAPYVPYEYGY
jgi:hypothetical protein